MLPGPICNRLRKLSSLVGYIKATIHIWIYYRREVTPFRDMKF